MLFFKNITGILGMGNPRQVGGRVSYHYYQRACATRVEEEKDFWHNGTLLFFSNLFAEVNDY